MRARQFERALYDSGPWTVHVNGVDSPARKVVGYHHVTFYAIVRLDQEATAELRCNGEVVAVKDLGPVGHSQIAWGFEIVDAVVAA
ncbi:hypothetical protein ACFRCW_36170 [Streptomyces sp. NPDC056653]|uniref:hypothetical protein n=1 Tax=Streptomyces sp. NPDC056653 TaxID=3345894 RepID=UPI0036BD7C09